MERFTPEGALGSSEYIKSLLKQIRTVASQNKLNNDASFIIIDLADDIEDILDKESRS